MKISVLIPSCSRPALLARSLRALAAQTHPPHEILVGLDGGTQDAAARARRIPFPANTLDVRPYEKQGYIPIRADLLRRATGEIFLSLNDDAVAEPSLLERHAYHHRAAGRTAVVAGAAPWAPVAVPNALDALIMRGDLVFFDVDQRAPLRAEGAPRRCYGLNFSAPVAESLAAGGFHDLPHRYGYDDIEFAWRFREGGGEIIAAPDARVVHHHRYDAEGLMRREYELGRAAFAYAGVSPRFMRDLLNVDLRDQDRLDRWRVVNTETHADAVRSAAVLRSLESEAWEISDSLLPALAGSWVPAKRWLWRCGVLDAAADGVADAAGAVQALGAGRVGVAPFEASASGGR